MQENQRECPSCHKLMTYSSKGNAKLAERTGARCHACASRSVMLNPEEVKKRAITRKTKDSDSVHRTPEARLANSLRNRGSKNAMYGKNIYSVWVEKYGKEEADNKLNQQKQKLSKASSGSNNPMYGRPAPKGSGNGWKGHYKGIYFRSLRELSFLVNYVERFKLKCESLERGQYKIQYKCPMGDTRNYFGDYLINGKYFVEVKPKRLQKSPVNSCKFEAAERFCKERGLIFKVIDPKLDFEQIKDLYNNDLIKFDERYEEKFKNYNS